MAHILRIGFEKCFLRRAVLWKASHSRQAGSTRHFPALLGQKSKGYGGPSRVLTQGFADITDRFEHHSREADSQSHCLHVGQAQAKHFVLRGEDKLCICLDSAFVQGPVRFQEPATLLFPPKGKVWPVLGYVCKDRQHSEVKREGGHSRQSHRVQKWKLHFFSAPPPGGTQGSTIFGFSSKSLRRDR